MKRMCAAQLLVSAGFIAASVKWENPWALVLGIFCFGFWLGVTAATFNRPTKEAENR